MRVRGVNLGNWLVLEKWMGGSPLSQAEAPDDRGLIDEWPAEQRFSRLRAHYGSYVTERDFAWLAQAGVNLVRIPVPYHVFGTAHHCPCVEYLDAAMDWAAACGMGVLIDLHTVPLGQNALDNSGYMGLCAWHRSEERMDFVLEVLRRLCRRYAGHAALWGIEPINEPASALVLRRTLARCKPDFPERVARSSHLSYVRLREFYERFYRLARPILGPDVRIVVHDGFRISAWDHALVGHDFENVWIDTHQYLCFVEPKWGAHSLSWYKALLRMLGSRTRRAARYHPVLVGEWSLGNHCRQLRSMGEDERRAWYRELADAQLDAWDACGGSCFWSYKTEAPMRENWSFVTCAERGWIDLRA
ncbi:MAG: cellulase family glycosylhydrolase [Coriobacteriales bacterium]|nr:cellulase family glycosylhydrolase [Coriobacteriales bacterium]